MRFSVASARVALALASIPIGGGDCLAQGSVTVPPDLEFVDGASFKVVPFGLTSSRSQILISRTLVARSSATITGIAFRPDNEGRNTTTMPAATATDLEVELSHRDLAAPLSQTFAQNVTEPQVRLFTGSVALPAHTPSGSGVAAWAVAIPLDAPFAYTTNRGDLLLEFRRIAPTPTCIPYWIDAARRFPTSSNTAMMEEYGVRGPGLPPELFDYEVSAGATFEIGTSFDLEFSSYPILPIGGAVLVGGRGLTIDLGVIGAPGNTLLVSPDVTFPFRTEVVAGPPARLGAALRFDIPNDQRLVGSSIAMQPFALVSGLNLLGAVGFEAVEITFGGPLQPPISVMDAFEHDAPVGTLVSVEPPVMRLLGTFQ